MSSADQLITAAHRVGRAGLSWGTSGNLSVRVDASHFLVTATGVRLGELTADQVVSCSFGSGEFTGSRRPSVEAGMHRRVLEARPDVGAVLHCSPTHATMLACSQVDVDPTVTTDSVYYVRSVGRVGFHLPGSDELAAAAADAARGADCLLLANHGCVVVGADADQAVNRAEALEALCTMLAAEIQGFALNRLSAVDVERLRRQGVG